MLSGIWFNNMCMCLDICAKASNMIFKFLQTPPIKGHSSVATSYHLHWGPPPSFLYPGVFKPAIAVNTMWLLNKLGFRPCIVNCSSMAQPPIGLDDIPNEIIIQIFDRSRADISTKSLLNLALSCRRLHFLCLPIYLARFGIKKPTEHCEIVLRGPDQTPGSTDALSGLGIALFIPYVENLVCRFQVPGDVEDYLYVGAHLRRLHVFISSLSSVKSVTLQFGNKRCGCCSELEPGETLDEDLKKWSNAMASVLNLLLEKSCGDMVITGGKFMCHTYILKASHKFHTPGPNTGALATIRRLVRTGKFSRLGLRRSGNWVNVLQGDLWEFKRDSETGKSIVLTSLSKTARTTSVLRSLTISSMMFGIPPLLHWMISVLRLPTTESLTLKNFPLNRKAWLVVLTLISEHCSHLTELTFSRLRQLNAGDVLYFIGRFPNLTSLHLGSSVEISNEEEPGSFPIFPHLKTLYAPSSWLSKLLIAQPHGLPALENISIVYAYHRGAVLHWLKKRSDTSIPMLLENSPLLSSISLKILLGKSPGFRMSEDSKSPKRSEPGILKKVDSLVIVIDSAMRLGDTPLTTALPKWLARFHGLRHLSIKAVPDALGDVDLSFLATRVVKEGKLPLLEFFEANGVEVNLKPE